MIRFISGELTKALVAAIAGIFLGWLKEHPRRAKRMRALEEGTKRIEFWNTFTKAVPGGTILSEDISKELERHLNSAVQTVNEVYIDRSKLEQLSPAHYESYRSRQNLVRRLLLTYYQPTKYLRQVRLVFWVTLADALLFGLPLLFSFCRIVVRGAVLQHPKQAPYQGSLFLLLVVFTSLARWQSARLQAGYIQSRWLI